VSRQIELVYDRLVAEEKLKAGTKYERLAAIAFRQITGRETVHDLRLVGSSGVAHQIDAVVGEARKRVLVEAKDYGKTVGLGIVRDFWAVVDDVRPDDAYIVTTEGFTKPAIKFAEARGIKLAVLRPPGKDDWGNLARRITLQTTITGQTGPPSVTWQLHPDDRDKILGDLARGLMDTGALELGDGRGQRRSFFPLIDKQLKEDYDTVPLGGADNIGRTNEFTEPTWLHAPGLPALRVSAWKWEVEVASSTEENVIGDGIGGLAAELVIRTVDDKVHEMVTNRQIQSWTFDGHDVVPRTG
jgi:hypothetical protein